MLTLDGHGLETDDEVTVRAAEGGTLASPFSEGTVYYAIRLTNATFKLAATVGGAAINVTSDGVEMIVSKEPSYDDIIEFVSRWADGFLPAHLVPLGVSEDVHPLVKGVVADVAAKRILNINGQASAAVDEAEKSGRAILERYAAGLPLRGASVPARTNLAISSKQTGADDRGWGSRCLP